MTKKKEFSVAVLVYLLQLALFVPLALERLVARDEGFYAFAARLISEGRVPYRDFFFPQMPLSAYLWSGWLSLTGINWISARILTALLTAVLGLLLFIYLRKKLGGGYAWAGLLLFIGSNFVFPWYLVVQTYSLSVLCLFISYWFLSAAESKKQWFLFLSGFFLGLAIDTRLFFAGLGPFLVLYLFFITKEPSLGFRYCLIFSIGALLALAPNLYFVLTDPDSFYYSNLGYHLARSSISPKDDLLKKITLFQIVLGLRETEKFAAFQYPLLIYFSVYSFLAGLICREKLDSAYLIIAALFVLNFVPSPSYLQYFCTLTPFLIITALFGVKKIISFSVKHRTVAARSFTYSLLLIFCILYFKDFSGDLRSYTRTGEGVIGINKEKNARNWTLERVRIINAKTEDLSQSTDKIVAFWPGYLLETSRSIHPGFENHFREIAARKLTPKDQKRYRVPSKQTVRALIRKREIDLVIFNDSPKRRGIKKALEDGGYLLVGQEAPVSFYRKP